MITNQKRIAEARKVMETGIWDDSAERQAREAAQREINEKVDRFLEGFDADYRQRLRDGSEDSR